MRYKSYKRIRKGNEASYNCTVTALKLKYSYIYIANFGKPRIIKHLRIADLLIVTDKNLLTDNQ